jgi:uncharacterized protein (DUF3084 family)
MTDQTESATDYGTADAWDGFEGYIGTKETAQVAAAIRALEAKVRELEAQHARDDEHYTASQTYGEKHRKNWVEACQQREQVRAQLESLHAMHDNLRDEYLATIADRDRLAGEVFNLRADVMQWQVYFKTMVEFSAHNHARLTSELAAARENEARYLAVKGFCEANAHVSAHSRRHRWSMEVNALDANPSFDAAIDAARSAGGEG